MKRPSASQCLIRHAGEAAKNKRGAPKAPLRNAQNFGLKAYFFFAAAFFFAGAFFSFFGASASFTFEMAMGASFSM